MKGKNEKNLKEFLPNHEPSPSVWEKIEAKLDATDSGKTDLGNVELKAKLPVHTPSDVVWQEIEHTLNANELRSRLPKYTPEENVWKNLNPAFGKLEKQTGRSWNRLKWAAAVIILLASALILKNVMNDKPEIEFHVEWEEADQPVDGNTIHANFDTEELSDNELIEQLCQRSQAACTTPEFKELERELIQLETARAEIKAQINPYGDNSKLERMLVHIELEHSKIVNQMTQQLL